MAESEENNSFVILDDEFDESKLMTKPSNDTASRKELVPSDASLVNANSIMKSCYDEREIQKELAKLLEENKVLKDVLKDNNLKMTSQFEALNILRNDLMASFNEQKKKLVEYASEFDEQNKRIADYESKLETVEKENSMLKKNEERLNSKLDELRSLEEKNICVVANKEVDDTIDRLTKQLNLIEGERRNLIEQVETLNWKNKSLEELLNESKQRMAVAEHNKERTCLDLKGRDIRIEELKQKLKEAYDFSFQPIICDLQLVDSCNDDNVIKFTENLNEYNKTIREMAKTLTTLLRDHHTYYDEGMQFSTKLETNIPGSFKSFAKCYFEDFKKSTDNYQSKIKLNHQMFKTNIKTLDKMFVDYQNVLMAIKLEFSSTNRLQEINKENELQIGNLKMLLMNKDSEISKLNEEIVELKYISQSSQRESVETQLLKTQLETYKRDFDMEKKLRMEILSEKDDIKSRLAYVLSENREYMAKAQGHDVVNGNLQAQIVEKEDRIAVLQKDVDGLRKLISTLQKESDERDLLRAQLDVYKNDFEAERQARSQIASEKADLVDQIRMLQQRNHSLESEGRESSQLQRSRSPSMEDMVVIDPPPPSYCPICGQAFRNNLDLQQHVYLCLDGIA